MTMLSDFYKFFNTADATVLPEHLKAGETAFGPDGKVVGTLGANDRVVLDYHFPVGAAGAYTPALSGALKADSALVLSAAGDTGLTLDADGLLIGSVNYASFLNITTAPAKATAIRKYSIWGRSIATPPTGGGIVLRFNRLDGNNYVEAAFTWENAFAAWRTYFYEVASGVANFRGTAFNLNAAVNDPITFHIDVYDAGDYIWAAVSAWETDDTGLTAADAQKIAYYAASRPNKAVLPFYWRWAVKSGLKVKGVSVLDL